MARKLSRSILFLGLAAASAASLLLCAVHAGAEDAPPPPPAFDKDPFSEERTAVPTAAEWKAAEPVTLDPMKRTSKPCSAKRVREWVQLSCSGTSVGAARMLGGKKDGLQIRFQPMKEEFQIVPDGADVAFPVRRGDQRVIELMEVEFGYHGSQSVSPWIVVSELWPADEPAPTIAIH